MLRKTIYNIPLLRKIISKIPMRVSLPLLITAPVVGVVIVLSAIAFLEGQSTANDLMEQNLAQIQDRIEERLDDLRGRIGLDGVVALHPRQVLLEAAVVAPDYLMVDDEQRRAAALDQVQHRCLIHRRPAGPLTVSSPRERSL